VAELKVYDMAGKEVSKIKLSDAVFGVEPNTVVMHEAVINYLANQRQGTQSTKTRSEVRGGGRKPYRQKGTGHARQGSTRSPQWRHGGIALGPKPRDYRQSMNKKARKLAIISALSSKLASGEMVVIDKIVLNGFKTKAMVEMLNALGADRKAMIVMPDKNQYVVKSASNIPGVTTALTNTINVYDILNCGKFIVTVDAVKMIEEVYNK
jgi:large subunit ribosomal protein L4